MVYIKLNKGMQFSGFNSKYYEVTENFTIKVTTSNIEDYLKEMELYTKVITKPTVNLVDELFLFRLAVVINDDNVILVNGTFTWMDDVYNMITAKVTLEDSMANRYLIVLSRLLDWLNDKEVCEARDLSNVDVLNTAIQDAAYNLYTDLVKRMLLVSSPNIEKGE